MGCRALLQGILPTASPVTTALREILNQGISGGAPVIEMKVKMKVA